MQNNFDQDLSSYFTDVEHLRNPFRACIVAPELNKRLLIIHGVGGVGKSSLLRMFRLYCKSTNVPVGFASGDEAKSPAEVLSRWADDLKSFDVKLSNFAKTIKHYRSIQAKVGDQARKKQEVFGKAAIKTVEAAASMIPVVGPFASVVGGMGAEALTDWLRGFLSKADIDLLLDPTNELTNYFLADAARAASKQRLVLMLDTLEQMSAMDDWVCSLVQQLGSNVLFVLAGRCVPNWSRQWHGWMAQAQVEELKPMTDEVMRQLVQRYYAAIRGGEPDPKQVEAIIGFARGLPMVVTSAVRLWTQYNVEDFQAIKPQVVADLVDRLMEGVPASIHPVLEAAATVRWFNKEILRSITGLTDVNASYNELRLFPFIRPRAEGLALHDTVREMLDENLKMHDPEWHRELHTKAAVYYEAQVAKVLGEESERIGRERLYHSIRADEESGTRLFRGIAEDLVRYLFVNRLRALMNDVNTYPMESENSQLWRKYYTARLDHIDGLSNNLEKEYESIQHDPCAEPLLRAYVACDLGAVLRHRGYAIRSLQVLESVPLPNAPLDSKLIHRFIELSDTYRELGRWNEAIASIDKAGLLFEDAGDLHNQIYTISRRRFHYLDWGIWKEGLQFHRTGLEALNKLPEHSSIKINFLGNLAMAWAWMGLYAEGEANVRAALLLAVPIGSHEQLCYLYRDLALLLAAQGKVDEAEQWMPKSMALSEELKDARSVSFGKAFQAKITMERGDLIYADENFTSAIDFYRNWSDKWILPLILVWRGLLYEILGRRELAEKDYEECLNLRDVRRLYHQCAAITGLTRIKHAQAKYAAIPSLLTEAEQLAQQYEYNDHLASLRLTQGQIAWDGHIPDWGNGFDAALYYYQHTLIYALRYNRYLLDEVLSGRPQGTYLRPIIPHCLERGEEGIKMLNALRDWWQIGANATGTPRPDTISPIPEGISLLEAEHLARQREPGDGSPQKKVIEQIDAAISSHLPG